VSHPSPIRSSRIRADAQLSLRPLDYPATSLPRESLRPPRRPQQTRLRAQLLATGRPTLKALASNSQRLGRKLQPASPSLRGPAHRRRTFLLVALPVYNARFPSKVLLPGTVPETHVRDIGHVQGTGYARSKYVAEQIVYNAAKDSGAEARVLRIGQLSGDTLAGEWNVTEGVPMLIQTAITLGCLPSLDEEMSWLPVDTAASIILDLALPHTSTSPAQNPELVYHVLNPHRFNWTRDMLPALSASGIKFDTMPTEEWMEKLRSSDPDPSRNPPIKLLGWFESKYGEKARGKPKGVLDFETGETERGSEMMGRVPDVTEKEYVAKVVERLGQRWGSV
jgi:hypothetical protein